MMERAYKAELLTELEIKTYLLKSERNPSKGKECQELKKPNHSGRRCPRVIFA